MRIRWGIAWDLGVWGLVVTKCEVCGVGSGDRLLDLEARGGLDVVRSEYVTKYESWTGFIGRAVFVSKQIECGCNSLWTRTSRLGGQELHGTKATNRERREGVCSPTRIGVTV